MEVLSLKNVWLEDKADLGFEIVYLAHLKHLGFNVPDGIVAYPPKRLLEELHKNYQDGELFNGSRERLKKEWLQQTIPESFSKICKSAVSMPDSGIKKLWIEMLEGWFEQLSRAVVMKRAVGKVAWLGGYALFVGISQKSGWMEITGVQDPKVVVTTGELDMEDHTRLELLAREVNKAIPVAVKLWWLRDDEMRIVRVSEIFFDQIGGIEVKSVGERLKRNDETKILATKILLIGDKKLGSLGDGWYKEISSVESVDLESAGLVSESLTDTGKKHIYRLGLENNGALEWMQNMERVRHDLQLVQELGKLTDADIEGCLPFCRSVVEYQTLRSIMTKMNFDLKKMFWLEMVTPENMLNIDSYLEHGVRGVIINVDRLAHLLQGLDNEVSKVVVPDQTQVLDSVIGVGIKKLHRANCRVVIAGERVYDSELLELAVKWGVWGVVTNQVNYEVVASMLEKSENNVFKNLSARE